jgi:hypothetical protein
MKILGITLTVAFTLLSVGETWAKPLIDSQPDATLGGASKIVSAEVCSRQTVLGDCYSAPVLGGECYCAADTSCPSGGTPRITSPGYCSNYCSEFGPGCVVTYECCTSVSVGTTPHQTK